MIKQRSNAAPDLRCRSGAVCHLGQPVGVAGFEPTTSSSRTKHATKLRHTPREATTAYRTGGVRSQTLEAGLTRGQRLSTGLA